MLEIESIHTIDIIKEPPINPCVSLLGLKIVVITLVNESSGARRDVVRMVIGRAASVHHCQHLEISIVFFTPSRRLTTFIMYPGAKDIPNGARMLHNF
jgi:hypothetical protein